MPSGPSVHAVGLPRSKIDFADFAVGLQTDLADCQGWQTDLKVGDCGHRISDLTDLTGDLSDKAGADGS